MPERSTIVMKLAIVAILALFSAFLRVLWGALQERAKQTLEEVEAGGRCMLCNSAKVTQEGTGKRCQQCGHLTDVAAMAWLNRAEVTDREIAAITRPAELEGVDARRRAMVGR